ncbi:RPII140-upstream gene protein [Condylostylus longicornis]|uniref:RPII140-upstream gene protein n=1 Tax=Condylostylus longicornis TaxID=2530218 RepID=UPI00244E51C6|nr:RPII140-upstream gene protein [Condylostylus longicornis]
MYYIKHFRPFVICVAPFFDITTADKITSNRTNEEFQKRKQSSETGLDRVKRMFKLDEHGAISNELNSIHQAGFLGFLIGAIYGGVINSRKAYIDFMENNEATAFKSHLDAKKKLQDQFTVSFAKGGFKWGWRIGLFTTSYVGIITIISVYREKSSIYEYLVAGSTTGAIFRANLGLRGMAAGGIVGGTLGGIAGIISLLLMKASGTTMEEIRYWQYKWKLDRDNVVNESIKILEPDNQLIQHHDRKVNTVDIKKV